ncbi:MAG: hypothetical protein H6732_17870 [Alphaproteobacteria bacterium]|nr:hypothetical protein [Alphaproteobacteria bacterium]
MAVGLGLAWTLWLAEGLLRLRPDPTGDLPLTAPRWHADGLPALDGHTAPRDYAAEPTDRPTIVVLGDSFAAGQGVTFDQAFPSLLESDLRADHPDLRVLRLARPSRALWDEVVLHGALGSRLDPEVVVWTVVLNDVGLPGHAVGSDLVDAPPARAGSGWALVDTLTRLRANRALEARTEALYQGAWTPERAEWRDARARMQQLVRAEQARGTRVVVAIFPLLHRLDAYPFVAAHEAIAGAVAEAGGEVVDLLGAFEGQQAATLWASRSDHHPNARAHALAAEAIAAAIRARPWPDAVGPTPCAALPSLPGLEVAQAAACAEGTAADLLALGRRLLAFDVFAPELGMVPEVASRALASDLAVVAAVRDPALRAEALALVQEARRPAP